MDLELLIKLLVKYSRKIVFCVVFYLIGLNIVRYGFLKTLFIFILVLIGYKLSEDNFVSKIKAFIRKKLED